MVQSRENFLDEAGCTAAILGVSKKYDDGRLDIVTEGKQRFEIEQLNQERSFLRGEVIFFQDEPSQGAKHETDTVIQLHQQLFEVLGQHVAVEPSYPCPSFQLP